MCKKGAVQSSEERGICGVKPHAVGSRGKRGQGRDLESGWLAAYSGIEFFTEFHAIPLNGDKALAAAGVHPFCCL